ncbi:MULTISPECIES: hypothetical protein [Rahnella]|uniref:hypothetical protein n=1 Tax=Rahnella TaxID=34037 RepID=UPI00105DC0D3|nr:MULTISPECIES: hypothetical protein [Rahnella]TDS98122.1 hypothetical protein EDF78_101499 [Rahnella sp. BIGb0236]UHM93050.1 hypothetical protein J9880_23415 [Rahnella victoriana]
MEDITPLLFYCVFSISTVFLLYYVFCHFLYSDKVFLNLVAFLLLTGGSKLQIDIGRSGIFPFSNVIVLGESAIYAIFPLAFWFLYVFSFGRAYVKYYKKDSRRVR